MTTVRHRVADTASDDNDAAGQDPVKDDSSAGEPPDDAQKDNDTPGVHGSAGPEENEELNWARRHMPDEPSPPREPALEPELPHEPEPKEEPENPAPYQHMKTGRGKGRPPHRMLKEAIAIAEKRGDVIPVPGGRSDAFDLIICEQFRNVFVRFRWSATQYLSARDVMERYPRDIGRIVRMPLTGVMAWEFWIFEPGNVWQFFLITHDGLLEIRKDGSIFYRPVLPVPVADSAGSSPGSGASGEGDGCGPGHDP